MKIVLARIFMRVSSLRERTNMSKKESRSDGESRRDGFANGRGLNVTRASERSQFLLFYARGRVCMMVKYPCHIRIIYVLG